MKSFSMCIAAAILLYLSSPLMAGGESAAVRMGTGLMTFDTVPGWGLGADGKSVLGPTHGGVTIDKAGNIYTSATKGVVVFSPDGKVIREFLGKAYSDHSFSGQLYPACTLWKNHEFCGQMIFGKNKLQFLPNGYEAVYW